VTEAKMNNRTWHGSALNATYLATIALATAGWLWLILRFVEWAIGI
jgi:hypothetical protein